MSFRLFIYYSALCGGWAAFLTWLIIVPSGMMTMDSEFLRVAIIGGLLGMFVAAAVGAVDAILNASGVQRITRALVCAGIGLLGGVVGSSLGEVLNMISIPRFVGWMIVGTCIGASVGLYDFLKDKKDKSQSRKKMMNGIYGGIAGGLVGGLFYALLFQMQLFSQKTSLVIGLVILGTSIGLMIGLAQVFLKEAWLKIEIGKRAGKELIISKEQITIGRDESCDLGLFGEKGIEKSHARIRMHKHMYVIEDVGTAEGTFVNDTKVEQPTRLQTGDTIRVGSCTLRFGERQKERKR